MSPPPTHCHRLAAIFPVVGISLRLLRQLHAQLLLHSLLPCSVPFASRLAHAYFAHGRHLDAHHLFGQMPLKTPHAYNTMLSGYFHSGRFLGLLETYKLSVSHSKNPDSFALAFAVRAATRLRFLGLGSCVHAHAVRSGHDTNPYVSCPLMDMYLELGTIREVEKVFEFTIAESAATWGLMMKGYVRAALDDRVFDLLARMKVAGVGIDACTAVCLARAYGNVSAAREGRAVHGHCVKANLLGGSNIYLETSLVDMYVKGGFVDMAYRLFYDMPVKDVVTWSSMVVGLAQRGKGYEALRVFKNMLQVSTRPNEITLSSVFLACAHLGALLPGKSVHGYMFRAGIGSDVAVNTALVDMYAKCGYLELAYKVFSLMPERNVYSWSAIIGGFSMHGMCSRALALFEEMKMENVTPNAVTFVAVLLACSRSGWAQEGRLHFESMMKEYNIAPTNEHYSCMVDLLGRAGLIEEARSWIEEMPILPSACVWSALLNSCRMHKRVGLAEEVANKLLVLESDQPGAHLPLANAYAAAEMWGMVRKTRALMNRRGWQKIFGFSTVEVDKRVFIFHVVDTLDDLDTRVTEVWRNLSTRMKELGYTPDLSFTLRDMEDEDKSEVLCGHSEKLAVAFGLLRTKDGTPLRITKNLRVCGDCHTACKFVSLITKREITLRDSKRFHHVKDGVCSCGDYW